MIGTKLTEEYQVLKFNIIQFLEKCIAVIFFNKIELKAKKISTNFTSAQDYEFTTKIYYLLQINN